MTRTVIAALLICSLATGVELVCRPQINTACAEEAWKTEFADICSKTDDPMSLSKAEIQGLLERCDKLKIQIEKLEESTAKVYLRRLQMCRDLFAFALESTSGK